MKETNSDKIRLEIKRRIDDYVNERLTAQEIDDLWSEMIFDEEALNYLKSVANLYHLAELEQRQSRGGRPHVMERSVRYGIVAVAAILIVAFIGFFQLDSTPEELEPIAQIELDYYRSSEPQADPTGREAVIREAIVLANQGEHNQAIRLIDSSLESTEDEGTRADLYMNAGSILYNISSYEAAALRFEQIVEMEVRDPLIHEKAYWYLGNAYFQLNRLQEAKAAFEAAYKLDGAYRRVAERYLHALPV